MAMHNPIATYRLQFHKGFTFHDFERILPYLQKLGVSTVYASPIFEATPGSTHGYDGVNPHRINPEVGTEKQLRSLNNKLKEQGISWLQDIVPNHMAYHPNNPWLMDVLEKGQQSVYAPFFDVAWTSEIYHGRIMVPFFGAPLEEVVEKGELTVDYQEQRLVLKYYDTAYPLHLRSYGSILRSGEGEPSEAIEQLLDQLEYIHQIEEAKAYSLQWEEFRQQFASLMKNAATKVYLKTCLKAVNMRPELLLQIANEQVYRLCYWQETDQKINFRRFFTVNGLICLNIQDKEVFEHYHKLIRSLLEEGVFQGLRIDHIDGLYDPNGYLEQLREVAGEETYIIVEKILEPDEDLPREWPIQGDTGYGFLSIVNNLFTQSSSEKSFTQFYQKLTSNSTSIHQQIRDKKAYILFQHMGGELNNLHQLFQELNLVEENALAGVGQENLRLAIGELLIQCPVYRYYGNRFPLEKEEFTAVQDVFTRVRESKAELAPAVNVLEEALLQRTQEGNEGHNSRALRFYQRMMQFTGPLMAKGVEDTLMYTYNRFIGHNEVGDSPEAFGLSPDEFHQKMIHRQQHWPLSLNATSTHDTKRGEDARTRLNVLTDLPEEWLQAVQEWQHLNADLKENEAPDANDEYFIYQTLVGTYPMQDEEDYSKRLQEYLAKALREAKLHSNWTTPNQDYEEATKTFATRLLDKKRPFWKSFQKFQQKVAGFGIVNSLAQALLKFTCPGIPDVYQGCELWDLSLVDPDNRRAVNFGQRQQWLEEFDSTQKSRQEELVQELWQNRNDARIKLWLVHTLFNERKQQPDLFAEGFYIPLQVEGKYKDNVLAFARRHQQTWYVVAVPLHLADVSKQQKKEVLALDWKDTRIILPAEAPDAWEHLLLKTKGKEEKGIAVKDIFRNLPLAILKLQHPISDRRAGVLLPITSLPSHFGVGDLGPEAKAFADFLSRSRQKYWQLLPLNPTELGQGHSPYSSISSMAGNTLLLSPELLAQDGLLDAGELQHHHLPQQDKADYAGAEKVKEKLFEKAWSNFRQGKSATLQRQFRQFCRQEAYWLHDFALYVVLKQQHEDKAWFQWPEKFKLRQQDALEQFTDKYIHTLDKVKWLQFLFTKQWKELKTYCNNRSIQLFGDLPFYISYDSADVWSHPDIFSLDEKGNMIGVCGVPPDYFTEDGQLWGMPVFRWKVLKEQGYAWWVQRIRKNMELYDLLRLDHFRAFSDYWEVPAGEETAKNGQWKPGPGAGFFQALQKELGELPFVAEDLGDINDAVYELRDEFMLPGMKVLQFAFGDEMPRSIYIPHNYTPLYLAYTGTHDNNTTRGWYRQDAGKADRKRLALYIGKAVSEKDVHLEMGRLAYASVAQTAILPIQDVLGLDETARMNTPASTESNWLWRLQPGQLTPAAEEQLREWTKLYNRG